MRRLCISLALALGAALFSSPARADGPTSGETLTAEARFQRGVTLYSDGDFAQALLEFRRAYQASPDFRVLYNIGLTEFQMGDYAAAYRTLSRYLSEGGAAVPEDRKRTVTAELQKLELRVGKLDVVVDVGRAPS
jgi:tetratricopeptide (TPR) repeat protein